MWRLRVLLRGIHPLSELSSLTFVAPVRFVRRGYLFGGQGEFPFLRY